MYARARGLQEEKRQVAKSRSIFLWGDHILLKLWAGDVSEGILWVISLPGVLRLKFKH